MESDWDLLAAYARGKEEAAFREIVRRHVDMVYGAARRMLGGPGEEAEDVTQAVFLLLAQRAGRISERGALAGWLYRATRFCCANVRKEAGRRRRREREAAMREVTVERAAEELAPLLDAGLAGLGEKERAAVLVRYLEGKTARETGAALGVSEAAAEKRVERGVAKLRGYFAKSGYAVPGAVVVGVMCGEAKAAPAGLAGRIGAGVGTSGSAAGIAKGAAAMMKAASVKMVAAGMVVAIAVAAGGIMATGAKLHEPAAKNGTALRGAERTMFVRWDEVVRDGGAACVLAAGTVKPTASVGYTVIEADAGKVRDALKEAERQGELLKKGGEQVAWASLDEWTPPGRQSDFNIFAHPLNDIAWLDDRTSVSVLAGVGDKAFLDARGGFVRVRLPGEVHETQLLGNGHAITKNLMMAYTGDVPVGRAVVFIGDLGKEAGAELYHVSVWEAFSCSEAEWPYVHHANLKEWREGGTELLRERADRALAWEQAGHSVEQAKPTWEKTLANGATVQVLAVCDNGKWPGCWWDVDGNPVRTPKEWLNRDMESGGVHVALGVTDPAGVLTGEDGLAIQGTMMGNARSGISILELKDGALDVGIGAGPWTRAGELKVGQMMEVAGVKAVVEKLEPANPKMANMAGSTWVHGKITESLEQETEVRAVDKAGKEARAWRLPSATTQKKELQAGAMTPLTAVVNLAAEDIGKLELWVRQRSWVRFEGIAMEPRVDPGTVALVEAKKFVATAPAALTAPAADRSTPEGAMRMFRAAIERHDAAGARGMMLTNTPEEGAIADAMVAQLIASDTLHAESVKRFGEAATEEALVRSGFAMQPHELPDMEWKMDGDTARQVSKRQDVRMVVRGPGSSLKRVKGEWFLDMSLSADVPEEQKKRIPQYVEVEKMQAALEESVAKEVEAGKYKDVYEARDSLNAGMEKVRKKAEGL